MTDPEGKRFHAYFKALHGYEPFPWQARLAASVLETGRWPTLLDIPTGLGKTSAIDIALFALAMRPECAPRRTLLVVDRRVVVDQAAQHARKIQARMCDAKDGVLADVASALRSLWQGGDGAPPFEVAVLRGGMPRDEAWAHRPDRPVVALSTVDQVGSRLLFRGYGVSSGMAPVHAGLLGNDALILLDEVQLSTAFAQTLSAIDERWRAWRENDAAAPTHLQGVPQRWGFVRMSATPLGHSAKRRDSITLDDEDFGRPVVQRRRNAHKFAALGAPIIASKSDADKAMRAVVEAFSNAAAAHLDAGAERIAVIVNRVEAARRIHSELKRRLAKRADLALLTGGMRPLDREVVFGDASDPASVAARVIAGDARPKVSRPVVVVSTQTIEAGADFDFDALVTECASLDALRQRFGRLDRRGEQGQTRATILVRKDQASDGAEDPIYGAALSATWAWLESHAGPSREVDFGIAHFPALPTEPSALLELCSPVRNAPVLLPAHLDAWAQTSSRGEPDPDVALWLHGPRRGTPEVRVVWRADLDADELNDRDKTASVERFASASLAVAPPSSLESVSVSLPAFRAWIARRGTVDGSDVEGAATDTSREAFPRDDDNRETRAFLIVRKQGAKLLRDPRDVPPEATVVVPASYGGLRDGNWDPEATEPVRDLGDWAQFIHRGRPVLRLVPRFLRHEWQSGDGRRVSDLEALDTTLGALPTSLVQSVPRVPTEDDPQFHARVAVLSWLENARSTFESSPGGWKEWHTIVDALLARGAKPRVMELADSGYYVVTGERIDVRREASRHNVDPTSAIVNDDDDSASLIGRDIGLDQHLDDVRSWVRRFGANVQMSAPLIEDLALAARLHDIGKADPRFQRWLHGGSEVRAAASDRLLAKSRGDSADRVARDVARQRAEYPTGYRHELLSIAMLEAQPTSLEHAHDPELVMHLVGSHHGWCRPFAPAVDPGPSLNVRLALDGARYEVDAAHALASVGSSVAARYWSLTERYGWWTLAWFEALVRLADHRASEERAVEYSAITRADGNASRGDTSHV